MGLKDLLEKKKEEIENKLELVIPIVENYLLSEGDSMKYKYWMSKLNKVYVDYEAKKMLMGMYDKLKHIENDTSMNLMLISSIKNDPVGDRIEKLINLLKSNVETSLMNVKKDDLKYSCQVCETLNYLEDIYKDKTDEVFLQCFEHAFIEQIDALDLYSICRLELLNLLYLIATKTTQDTHFDLTLVAITNNLLYGPEELVKEVYKILMKICRYYYLKYPPIRLLKTIVAFIHNLKLDNVIGLKFLGCLSFDKDYNLLFAPWGIASYYSGWEYEKYKFPIDILIDNTVSLFSLDISSDMLETALQNTLVLAKSHYGLRGFGKTQSILNLLGKSIKENKSYVLIIIEIIKQVYLQMNPNEVKQEATQIYNELLKSLRICRKLLRTQLEEHKKTNSKSKTITKNEIKDAIKSLLQILNVTAYISKQSLDELFIVLQMYIEDSIMIKMFAKYIQEILAGIKYSGLIDCLSEKDILKCEELTIEIGWRNLYLVNDCYVPLLSSYMQSKQDFPTKVAKHIIDTESIIKNEEVLNARKSSNETHDKLKHKLHIEYCAQKLSDHYSYQTDFNIAIHLAIENTVQFLCHLKGDKQSTVIQYLSKLLKIEMGLEKKPTAQHVSILNELLAWIPISKLSRSVVKKPLMSEGKFFFNGGEIVQVINKNNIVKIVIRGGTYEIMERTEVYNIPIPQAIDPQINYKNLIEDNKELLISTEEIVDYRDFIRVTPMNVQSAVNNKIPIEVNEEFKRDIERLDNCLPYNHYSIGVIYIGKEPSTGFLQFISKLGNLVYKGESTFRLERRDFINSIVFNVNILKQTNNRIEVLNNVTVVWKENELVNTIKGISFSIEPLVTGFCRVEVMNAVKGGDLEWYGPIPESGVVHESCLPKMMLRAVIVADDKMKSYENSKKNGFTSQLIKRQLILNEIKKKLVIANET